MGQLGLVDLYCMKNQSTRLNIQVDDQSSLKGVWWTGNAQTDFQQHMCGLEIVQTINGCSLLIDSLRGSG